VPDQQEDQFRERLDSIGPEVITLSETGQRCDITFFRRKPLLDVIIDPAIHRALAIGISAADLQAMFRRIQLSNAEQISLEDIWTIHPMPNMGFSFEQLLAVDLAEAEDIVGLNGETLRDMVRNTHHCGSREAEDFFLRRIIAS